jgi:hypothetical protein
MRIGKTKLEIVMGKPGVGKSTFAAKLAKLYLNKGYPVWSNTPIRGCFQIDCRKDLMSYNVSDGLLIVDEAGIEFDNRDWKNFTKNLVEFFKTYRHYRMHVLILSQSWEDVDKKIRQLASSIYILNPTIFGLTHLCLKEVSCYVGISEDEQIVEKYSFKPFWLLGTRYYYKRDAWKMFDTYERKKLQNKEWQVWASYTHVRTVQKLYHFLKNTLKHFKVLRSGGKA